jgi:peptide/nickel transport system permease protein
MTTGFELWNSPRVKLGGCLLAGLLVMAILGPLFVVDPTDFLGSPLEPPSTAHFLGTTRQGQDVLAQTVVGARTSLFLGFLVGALTVAIGTLVGLLAGTLGGLVDDALSLITNVFLILPGLPLSVVLAAYLEASPFSVAAVLILTGWAWNARVIRAQVLTLARKDYVEAAIVAGETRLRVLLAEILPNMLSVVASCFMNAVIHSLGAQVGLEFLGLGDVSQVTWGTNLYWAANNQALLTESWWTIVPTGLLIALTGLSLILLQFGMDEIGQPRLRRNAAFADYLEKSGLRRSDNTPVVLSSEQSDSKVRVSGTEVT